MARIALFVIRLMETLINDSVLDVHLNTKGGCYERNHFERGG